MNSMKKYNECRCCGDTKLKFWLTLGESPVANALFYEPNYEKFPLDLNYCTSCGHMQLASAPDPDSVFAEYRYRSGVSSSFRKHFEEYATTINSMYNTPGSVLEIGSNDAYLLHQFKNKNWVVFGVEPSGFLKQDHDEKEIPVYQDYFGTKLVDNNEWYSYFDVVCANNVLAHIPDMKDVIKGISYALKDDGILVVECGDQEGITTGKYLDNVYHEHIDYYTPYSFSVLAASVGLVVESVEKINTHGASFRIIARKKFSKSNIAFAPLSNTALDDVVHSIHVRQEKMQALINNRKFYAYGAAAKAVTALYTLNLVNDNLIGVVDDNELKQGCYFPGTNIMITVPEHLDKNTLIVITAWNVYDDIKRKLVERGHLGEIICMQ
jgi:SAM-dependent methyltransferase